MKMLMTDDDAKEICNIHIIAIAVPLSLPTPMTEIGVRLTIYVFYMYRFLAAN